ncbi:family 2 glycosyl transferase [Clostridium celatum]|uniref:family 2 glycosyl transferase n=1 Tax=Clostridium celatum TaxID=36834 RepID=UPI002A8765A8|nr:family 2 glycosyl transferase [Clostridium celatum]
MKRYLQIVTIILILIIGIFNYGYLIRNKINISSEEVVQQVARTNNTNFDIYINGKWKTTFLKGVNIGASKPGYFPGEFGITKDDYLRWFKQIKEMNANVIRVYTLQMPEFYEALFEFNRYRIDPLYIIHGVWIDEELMLEEMNAFSPNIKNSFNNEIATIIDVIHGNAETEKVLGRGYGKYTKDISPYVIGYILGIEWDPYFVKSTNEINVEMDDFDGEYLYTNNASAIEMFFAQAGNHAIDYESKIYNMQKPIAFTNWLTTDPIDHENDVDEDNRIADINTENIKAKDSFKSGLFASYHIYPYYPDFLNYDSDYIEFLDEDGNKNSYKAYLRDLKSYHTVPIVVSEFGVPSSRGITHKDLSRGFNQGLVSEKDQGEMNVEMLNDIYDEGYAGAIVFSWQDEWFKRTWNTMDMDVQESRPYWGDRMTNEEYFGLLAFEPGKRKSVSYIDGKINEWNKKDIVSQSDNITLYMKSDEEYLYFRVNKKNLNLDKDEIFIPIDITPKSGSTTIENYDVIFNEKADFIIDIKGKDSSKVLINDYYDVSDFLFNEIRYESNDINSFKTIRQVVLGESILPKSGKIIPIQYVEVGNLIYGNGNPNSNEYNSLSDFIINGDDIEIRIPWLMLNISDPSNKMIIDDFNKSGEINHVEINKINVGVYVLEDMKQIQALDMKAYSWNKWIYPTYHERLKESYYILKEALKEF